jgi:hypothetical protein
MPGRLTSALGAYPVIVLDGCDGTGKTTLAEELREQFGYAITHSGRTPDGIDLAGRYRQLLAMPGRLVLDRSFISELVYGPLLHGRSRITQQAAVSLAQDVAQRGGTLVHLTGAPEAIAARLRARDGAAPPVDRIRAITDAFHGAFALLAEAAPVITADTTETVLPESLGPNVLHEDTVREPAVDPRRVLLDLRLDLSLQVDPGHLRKAEEVQRHVRQLLADRAALLAPGVERFRDLTLQEAELQGHVGRVEPLGELVLPSKLLAGPDVQLSPCRCALVAGKGGHSHPRRNRRAAGPDSPPGHDAGELTGTSLWIATCVTPGDLWTSPVQPAALLWTVRTFRLARRGAHYSCSLEAVENRPINSLSALASCTSRSRHGLATRARRTGSPT